MPHSKRRLAPAMGQDAHSKGKIIIELFLSYIASFCVLMFVVFVYYYTGLRSIYVIFFEILPISFQMENNDDMRL